MAAQLSFVGFAWKNLWRRRLRTVLTLCGISMAIGAFVGLVGFSRSIEHEWLRVFESSGTDISVVRKTFLNTSVDESAAETLKALSTVAHATPMILNMMDLTPEVNALVYGWRADSFEFQSIHLITGRRYRDGRPEVMLGDLLAENLNKKTGDALEIQGARFTISGVFHGDSAFETAAVIMPLDQLQELGSLQGKASVIHIRLQPVPPGEQHSHYLARAQAEIEAALPGLRAVPAAERASDNQIALVAHASAWGTTTIALIIGILGIANTMAMSVFERTREIGILRALGWRRWQVLLLIQVEAAALGLAGGLLGIAVGVAALHVMASLPQTATFVTTTVAPMVFVQALGIAVLSGLAAGAVPAWRGARLSPVEALRHD